MYGYEGKSVRIRTKKKNYQPVSRILCPAVKRVVIIYLAPALLQGSSCLPSGIGRAVLKRRYTWHFSMQGLPAPAITHRGRGLLPPIFTLTPTLWPFGGRSAAVIFCGTIYWRLRHSRTLLTTISARRHPALNRYIALCCPDFPPLSVS